VGQTLSRALTTPKAALSQVWRDRQFESVSLQRRVNKLSVPLEMLVEGSIRRARTDWPSGGIARGNADPHYFTYDGPPATRRRPECFADAEACTSQSTARAASQLHLPRRRADSPAPPSSQIKHRKRLVQLHGGISATSNRQPPTLVVNGHPRQGRTVLYAGTYAGIPTRCGAGHFR